MKPVASERDTLRKIEMGANYLTMTKAMTRLRRFFLVMPVLFLLALVRPMMAVEAVFEFDPAKTLIEFTVSDPLHTVHGNFKLKSGAMFFEPSTGEAGGLIIIDATSGNSGGKSRDRWMHKNLLESDKYPEIVFTPLRVKGSVPSQGAFHVDIEGTMKLHGGDHVMTLTVQGETTNGETVTSTQFAIPYVQWGLKNPSNFLLHVGDKVTIDIKATGRLKLE
jgi:polyisoprenoid-binding protein YceI